MKLRALAGFVLLISPWPLFAQDARANSSTTSPQNQLQQLTTQLQQSPGDQALRERIINLARTMVPPPTLPEETERRMARGVVAFKEAKSVSDYKDAVAEFEKATLAAPWYADAYYNLGLARANSEDYAGAAASLKLYLLAGPGAKDAAEAKALAYEMEYKQEKADKKQSEEQDAATNAAHATARQASVYQGLDGGVWVLKQTFLNDVPLHTTAERSHARSSLEIHGHEIESYYADDYNARRSEWRTTFASRQFQRPSQDSRQSARVFTVSEDGQSITEEYTQDGTKCRYVFERAN